VGWIVCLVLSIIKMIKDRNVFNIISLIVVILTAFLVLFFPFREVKVRLELNLYENERLEIIKMVEDNKLEKRYIIYRDDVVSVSMVDAPINSSTDTLNALARRTTIDISQSFVFP
jgi:hypothetical protein